jgi:hypothetical protein
MYTRWRSPFWVLHRYSENIACMSKLLITKAVFWDVAPCRYCVNHRIRGTYRLHLQGRRKNKISASGEPAWAGANLLSYPPKRRLTQYLHGATSQKTAFFIVTAVKTSNLANYICFIRITRHEVCSYVTWTQVGCGGIAAAASTGTVSLVEKRTRAEFTHEWWPQPTFIDRQIPPPPKIKSW